MFLRRISSVGKGVLPLPTFVRYTHPKVSMKKRYFSSVPTPTANHSTTVATATKRKISYEEESFVSKHFGKLSLVVLGVIGGLIYTYYLSIQDRKKVEEIIDTHSAIDPYEILQLRHMNKLTKEEFQLVLQACAHQIATKQPLTYRDFISLVTQTLTKQSTHTAPIQSGFLLDRMVQHLVQRTVVEGQPLVEKVQPSLQDTNTTSNTYNNDITSISSTSSSSKSIPYIDVPLPVDLLCVIFNMTMLREPNDRCESLYALGEIIEGKETFSTSNALANSLQGEEKGLSLPTVQRIVELLQATDQIPTEKQIKETGTVWPVRTYCRKSFTDLMKEKFPESAVPSDVDPKSKDAFKSVDVTSAKWFREDLTSLLLSRQVCAWGSCYKDREDDD